MSHYVVRKPISDKVIQFAKELAPEGKLNHRTMTNGERNVLGAIGEIYVFEILTTIFPELDGRIKFDSADSYDHDLLLDTTKVDVKTKQRTSQVMPYYDASILEYSMQAQKCDRYDFCSIIVNNMKEQKPVEFCYLGHITKAQYALKSTLRIKGEPDGGNRRPDGSLFTIKENCFNMKYSELDQYPKETLLPLRAAGYELYRW